MKKPQKYAFVEKRKLSVCDKGRYSYGFFTPHLGIVGGDSIASDVTRREKWRIVELSTHTADIIIYAGLRENARFGDEVLDMIEQTKMTSSILPPKIGSIPGGVLPNELLSQMRADGLAMVFSFVC